MEQSLNIFFKISDSINEACSKSWQLHETVSLDKLNSREVKIYDTRKRF